MPHSTFFEQLFGTQGRRRPTGVRGQDFEADLQLTLQEAATTHRRVIQVFGRKLRITIPAGIANGQRIKLAGKGGQGTNGGTDGDLYLTLHILPDPRFERQDDDLMTTAHIDLYTALLGGETTIDTLTGQVRLKVKPLTQKTTSITIRAIAAITKPIITRQRRTTGIFSVSSAGRISRAVQKSLHEA